MSPFSEVADPEFDLTGRLIACVPSAVAKVQCRAEGFLPPYNNPECSPAQLPPPPFSLRPRSLRYCGLAWLSKCYRYEERVLVEEVA